MDVEYGFETRCVHPAGLDHDQFFGAVSVPIFETATFSHPEVGHSSGYDYTRMQNPTREILEKTVASLEGGIDAIAFATGMAAIATTMELFQPGDHLIVEEGLYGGSIRLFDHINRKNGVSFTSLDISRADVEAAVQPNTKAIFLETPTNPMMNVVDLTAISEIAKRHGLLLIVDNTFLTPYLQNPFAFGADIVIHSGTKYLGGHNDVLSGFVVVKEEELSERIRFVYKTTGASLSPHDSWLVLRGIETLGIRMDRAQENAQRIAEWLATEPKVTAVYYPGLPSHPGHEIMKKQSRGFGAMVSFAVDSKETAISVLNHVELIRFAESLGGTESLLTYPITQTHADVPEEQLKRNGITDALLRFSVGIERCEDLIRDLKQALHK